MDKVPLLGQERLRGRTRVQLFLNQFRDPFVSPPAACSTMISATRGSVPSEAEGSLGFVRRRLQRCHFFIKDSEHNWNVLIAVQAVRDKKWNDHDVRRVR